MGIGNLKKFAGSRILGIKEDPKELWRRVPKQDL